MADNGNGTDNGNGGGYRDLRDHVLEGLSPGDQVKYLIAEYIRGYAKALKGNLEQLPEETEGLSLVVDMRDSSSRDEATAAQEFINKRLGELGLSRLLFNFSDDGGNYASATFVMKRLGRFKSVDDAFPSGVLHVMRLIATAEYFESDKPVLFNLLKGFANSNVISGPGSIHNPVFAFSEVGDDKFYYRFANNTIRISQEWSSSHNAGLEATNIYTRNALALGEELFHFLDHPPHPKADAEHYKIAAGVVNERLAFQEHGIHNPHFKKLATADLLIDNATCTKLYAILQSSGYTKKLGGGDHSPEEAYANYPEEVYAKYANGRAVGALEASNGLMSAYYDNIIRADVDLIASGIEPKTIFGYRVGQLSKQLTELDQMVDEKVAVSQGNPLPAAEVREIIGKIEEIGRDIRGFIANPQLIRERS